MKAQGIGVHKPEEIIEFGQNDLKVLSDMLADKPFFFGDEPTTVSTLRLCPCRTDPELQFFMLLLVHFSWTSWHLLAWRRYTSLTKRFSTRYETTCRTAVPIWWGMSTG